MTKTHPEDFMVGEKGIAEGDPCTVVFCRSNHSVTSYIGYVLVRFDRSARGWMAYGSQMCLVPNDAPHLHGLNGLLWVKPERIEITEDFLGYEIDED